MTVERNAAEYAKLGDHTIPMPVRRSALEQGFRDLYAGLAAWRLWTMLGWNDIRQRYRRSLIGPFWITISMAIFTVLLGVIYSRIFNLEISFYLPYIAAGLITWGLISSTVIESTGSFIEGVAIIRQMPLPLSIFVLRTVWRCLIVFAHTIVLLIPLELWFNVHVTPVLLLFVPGLALVMLNQIWMALVIGLLSTRFRDIPPLIATAVQVMMFATPIMWPVDALGDARFIADVNPVYHLVDVIRAPILGAVPSALSYVYVVGMIVVGYLVAAWLLFRSSKRLVYWL
jgi:ABC-type polysaccharide/polyol phosphate export permease